MTRHRGVRFTTVAALCAWGAISARAADAGAAPAGNETGDLWEVSSKMSMEGMPMELPAQTSSLCTPKTWTEPPAPKNPQQECTNSDFQQDGSKATWKITCGAPHPMTGTGEIVRDGDAAYTGSIKLVAEEGNMTIKLDGRRVKACDPSKK